MMKLGWLMMAALGVACGDGKTAPAACPPVAAPAATADAGAAAQPDPAGAPCDPTGHWEVKGTPTSPGASRGDCEPDVALSVIVLKEGSAVIAMTGAGERLEVTDVGGPAGACMLELADSMVLPGDPGDLEERTYSLRAKGDVVTGKALYIRETWVEANRETDCIKHFTLSGSRRAIDPAAVRFDAKAAEQQFARELLPALLAECSLPAFPPGPTRRSGRKVEVSLDENGAVYRLVVDGVDQHLHDACGSYDPILFDGLTNLSRKPQKLSFQLE